MNVLRLAWSSYQDQESLRREENALKQRGFQYLRVEPNGPLPSKLAAYDVLLINSQFEVTRSFLDQWSGGLILTTSNGYDHVNLDACRQQGVPVARTPAARAEAVVDHTFGFIDALLRDHHRTGRRTRKGEWPRSEAHENIRDVNKSVLGVLGYGVIGRTVVERATNRNFRQVLVNDPLVDDSQNSSSEVTFTSRDELVTSSDIVTLHTDLNPSTREMVDSNFLDDLGTNSYLLNTARGQMIDFPALCEALRSNRIGGAALDVFPEEPPEGEPLDEIPGLLTTPHSGGFHPDLLEELRNEVVSVLVAYRDDDSILNPVTPRSEEERRRLESQPDV